MKDEKSNIVPKFQTEDEEANWWESREGRAFLKQQSTGKVQKEQHGSALVNKLTRESSMQIALRLPAPDLAKAREIANRKEIVTKRF